MSRFSYFIPKTPSSLGSNKQGVCNWSPQGSPLTSLLLGSNHRQFGKRNSRNQEKPIPVFPPKLSGSKRGLRHPPGPAHQAAFPGEDGRRKERHDQQHFPAAAPVGQCIRAGDQGHPDLGRQHAWRQGHHHRYAGTRPRGRVSPFSGFKPWSAFFGRLPNVKAALGAMSW